MTRLLIFSFIAAGFILSIPFHSLSASEEDKPSEIRLDYATYNLSSLVLKKFGWLEEDLQADGIQVRWLFSAGSNRANEQLSANVLDFGSTAGSAALLARNNGVPLRTVYVYSRPEWSQILVKADSPIQSVADLRGRRIAATRGTDPFSLALRALREAGLSSRDVEIVNLQHSDGYIAWQRGNVDAWAALDPFLANALLHDDARTLFRRVEFNTFGTLNVHEDFLARHPSYVVRVLHAYERARAWIIANPEETAQILADEANIDITIASNQLSQRTSFQDEDGVGVPGELLVEALASTIPILVEERIARPRSNPQQALETLIYAEAAQQAQALLRSSSEP